MRDVLVAALAGWIAAISIAVIALRMHARRMEIVARASHELRAPITAARLGLELGARLGELSPVRLRAIELELDRTTLALDDLAGRRAARHLPAAEELDLEELLAQAVEAWQGAAVSSGCRLCMPRSGAAAIVRGDRQRLAQATGNLIANAIEHGGGVVEVHARAEDAQVRVEVLDGGAGLPAPVAELTRRARGGRGARGRGLAIAAAIATEHGGRLAAAPSERGARLVLELPAALPGLPVAAAGWPAAADPRGRPWPGR